MAQRSGTPDTPPTAYQAALAEAAAARAARKATTSQQAAVQMAAAAGESAIATRERAADYAKQLIRELWATVNPYDQAEVDGFAAKAAKIMATARVATGRAAAAAVVKQLKTMGVTVKAVPSLPKDVRGSGVQVSERGKVTVERRDTTVRYDNGDTVQVKVADMTTEEVFKRPAGGFRWVQSEGGTDAAERSGLRIDQIVDDELMLAQRLAETEVMVKAQNLDVKGAKVIGYRRVIHPELSRGGTCGMCIAAADRVYKASELRPIHANCKCTIAPITTQHDPGDELNKADLQQLYADAGGTSAAHLKRTRYKVDEHGELGPVLVPQRPYTPRDAKKRRAAANNAHGAAKNQESKADVAARHLPQLEKSLADLRSRGLAEDSPQVTYHQQQIDRLRGDLRDASQQKADMPPTPPIPPASGGAGGGGSDDDWNAHVAYVKQAIDAAPTSEDLYKDEFGFWTDERADEQLDLLEDFWQQNNVDAVPREGRAIIAGGTAGAGKGTILGGPAGIDRSQYFTINPDDVKEAMAARGMVPEIAGLSPMEASTKVHEEASMLAMRLAARAYQVKVNVIWDITMGNEKTVTGRINAMRSAGYTEIDGVFVSIPLETSRSRAMQRWRDGQRDYAAGQGNGGRYVPDSYIDDSKPTAPGFTSRNEQVFDQVRDAFTSTVEYDNSGTKPVKRSATGPRWE